MVWYQELGDIQMNTVKQEEAWDEETTLSYVKSGSAHFGFPGSPTEGKADIGAAKEKEAGLQVC